MPRSTARIGRHPLHPALVLLPIGFWLSAFVCDIGYWQTGEAGWAEAAVWFVGLGILGAALAAIAGLVDFMGDRAIRDISDAWQHMIGNVIAVVLALLSWGVRLSQGAEEAVLPWGLTLSTLIVVILAFTGWKGGELVFRHGVGVDVGRERGRRSYVDDRDDDRPVLH